MTSADDRSTRPPQADDDSSFPGDTRDAAAAKHHTPAHMPSLPVAAGLMGDLSRA